MLILETIMAQWQAGRWSGARQAVSPNCRPRGSDEQVELVVLHNISLPPFEYGSDAVEKLFTNQINGLEENAFLAGLKDLRVSAHFFVRRNGETVQFVSCDDVAYHAGVSSFRGREGCNPFSVGIELEGCDFEPFAEAQYTALHDLLTALCAHYSVAAITGHQDIAPNRKTDPGHFFDWDKLAAWRLPLDRNGA